MSEEELQQLRADFLKETIEFYKTHERAFIQFQPKNPSRSTYPRCVYSPTKDSPGCAVGRWIEDKELCKKFDDGEDALTVENDPVFAALPEKLKVLGSSFLFRVQSLHDDDMYWEKTPEGCNRLSRTGCGAANFIIDKYKLPMEKYSNEPQREKEE